MKTAPKRKLVSMDAPSREAVRKGNDNDAAGKTGLLENGVDIYTIKDLMGHTNVRITQIYTHIVNEQKEKAANTLHIENLTL